MGDTVVLACRNLRKRFDDKVAIDDVSFEVERGRIVGLLGPNGAGKTTLIRMILDIFPPDEGTIAFLGKPLTRDSRHHLGYLPEERGLYRRGKLAEVLIYLARLRGVAQRVARDRVHAALEALGYAEYANRRITDLSKGMAQRVQFIVASVHMPELIILDEPFSGLDPVGVQWASQQIRGFRDAGATVLLSAHQMALVEQLCDSVVMVHQGKRVLYGTVDEVRQARERGRVTLTTPDDLATAAALGSLERRHLGGERWELLSNDPENVLRQLVEAGVRVREFAVKQPTLEEIFLDIVGATSIEAPPGLVDA
jgi:ABC-2 type transport system ATP-binding protein